jgi:photosystem II stability/assembly factor-like uncharacterized protein
MARVALLVGTRKGAFVIESGDDRRSWDIRGPLCEGYPIHAMAHEAATGRTYAAGGSPWYGATVFASADRLATWTQSSAGLAYAADAEPIATIWSIEQVNGDLYAGVEPAGLFRSTDGGATWEHVSGLTEHPTRPDWQPGGGGLCLHTIVGHPDDASRMWVGISAVGVFETRDGGASWATRNTGVRAVGAPDPYPEFGQCVHKMVMASGAPDRLYQQNHSGVYRSQDGGVNWEDANAGLPSTFGFPMAAHPRDPGTAWVVPLNGDDRGRFMPDGAAAVWRTRDGASTWQRLSGGLPQENAFVGVLREAMSVDTLEPAGVYVGTSSGELWASPDEGERWTSIASRLPAIWSVDAVVLDD